MVYNTADFKRLDLMGDDDIELLRREIAGLRKDIAEIRENAHSRDTETLTKLHGMDLALNNLESRINEFRPVIRGYYGLVTLIVSTVTVVFLKMMFGDNGKP